MLFEDEYAQKVAELIEKIKVLGFDKVKSFQDAMLLVPKVIKLVEEEQWVLDSEDKREVAIELLNQLVDLPLLPEALEAQIFGIMIDVSITVLNDLFGKLWIERIK